MALVQETCHNPVTDAIFPVLTYLGEAGVFWIALSLILLIPKKTRLAGFSMLCAVLLGFLVGELTIKNIVCRPRPFRQFPEAVQLLISPPSGYSFPSGHSSASFAAALSLFFQRKKWGVVALALACLIAFSRVFLFVHWPTDVLTGIALGILSAVVVRLLLDRYGKNLRWLHGGERGAKE